MRDPRIAKLAYNLINNSCKLQPGEKILIENTGYERDLVSALIEEAYKAGGLPFVWLKDPAVNRAILMGLEQAQAELLAEHERGLMSKMQAYIGLRSGDNGFETSDVPAEKHELFEKTVWANVHGKIRVPETKWVVLRSPNP